MTEVLVDPEFDDPAQWNVNSNIGSIHDGVLEIAPLGFGFGDQIYPVQSGFLVGGKKHRYQLIVSATSGIGNIQLAVGGSVVWTPADGIGTFTGHVVADEPDPLLPINPFGYGVTFFMNTYGTTVTATFNSLTVDDGEYIPPPSTEFSPEKCVRNGSCSRRKLRKN